MPLQTVVQITAVEHAGPQPTIIGTCDRESEESFGATAFHLIALADRAASEPATTAHELGQRIFARLLGDPKIRADQRIYEEITTIPAAAAPRAIIEILAAPDQIRFRFLQHQPAGDDDDPVEIALQPPGDTAAGYLDRQQFKAIVNQDIRAWNAHRRQQIIERPEAAAELPPDMPLVDENPDEFTVAIIKAHAVAAEATADIQRAITLHGLRIEYCDKRQPHRDEVIGLYGHVQNYAGMTSEKFEGILSSLTDGPCEFMILSGPDAIYRWRALMGPTDPKKAPPGSIRHEFGKRGLPWNATHGSDSPENAEKERRLFGLPKPATKRPKIREAVAAK